jgi:hypothetical protein
MNDKDFKADIFAKTASEWTAENPYLARNDLGIETDTGKQKIGVGSKWADTPYVSVPAPSGPTVTTLTYAATVTTDASAASIFDLTLTGNVTLGNPTNGVNGQTIRWRIRQDATGNRTVTLGNKFQIPSSATTPLAWSTAANAMDILAATYHAGRDRWDVVALVTGY